jgi:two-component system alkaline phosphatase synthesis response regulator PhoP
VRVDFRRREACRGEQALDLSRREFELLRYLVDHRGQVLSRERLLEAVWGYDQGTSTRTIDMHVAKLRKKLEPRPHRPAFIVTVHGVGYRFDG